MGKPVAPSRVARTMAAAQWPDVQDQRMLAKGIYSFSCAGHGGVIAVHGVADIPEVAWEIARAQNLVELVGLYYGRMLTSERYTRETFDRMRERGMPVWEVWVGEEDCAWATILLVSPAAVAGAARNGWTVDQEMVEQTVKSWNPDFYTALTGLPVSAAESYVIRKREFAERHANDYVVNAAWGSWEPTVPDGMVGVSATLGGQDGESRYFLVPAERYDQRGMFADGGGFVITDEAEWDRKGAVA